jgi:hypothetical protein
VQLNLVQINTAAYVYYNTLKYNACFDTIQQSYHLVIIVNIGYFNFEIYTRAPSHYNNTNYNVTT